MDYSIITLNYDLILENTAAFLSSTLSGKDLKFSRPEDGVNNTGPILAKLHGSVDSTIIAPTWNKTINDDIVKDWQAAYQLLQQANYIRIIGYSLPISDAYIRYLLKSSFIKNDNLKAITIYCLDDEKGTTEKKYSEFLKLPAEKWKFVRENVTSYFDRVAGRITKGLSIDDDAKNF